MKIINESVGLPIGESIKVYQVNKLLLTNPYHLHSEIEIALVKKGNGIKMVSKSISSYSDWDLSIYGSKLPHSYISDGSSKAEHSIIIQFSDSLLNLELPEFINISNLIKKSNAGITFSKDIAQNVYQDMLNMENSSGIDRYLKLLCLLEHLASKKDYIIVSKASNIAYKDERIQKAVDFMRKSFSEKIKISDCAKVACMSISGFRYLFAKEFQITPIKYLIDLRLCKACELLIDSNKTIIEIAFECGFENLSNFNRHFKENIGMQPFKYRKLNK